MRTLNGLDSGESAVIYRLDVDGKLRRRLGELGLYEGAKVRFLCRAPLGDPVAVEVGGFRIAIRAAAADEIFVKGE